MKEITVTFEEEQQIKKWGIQYGIDIPWESDGRINQAFLIGLKVGGALGKILETHGPDAFVKCVNSVSDITKISVNKGRLK